MKRNFIPAVRVRDGKPCSLKRHFRGCLQQVIGYADRLAASEPERFVWAGPASFLKNATRYKGSVYSRRQVFEWIRWAEEHGLLVPVRRERHGLRDGWIVASHDDVCHMESGYCVMTCEPGQLARKRGEKRALFLVKHDASMDASKVDSARDAARHSARETVETARYSAREIESCRTSMSPEDPRNQEGSESSEVVLPARTLVSLSEPNRAVKNLPEPVIEEREEQRRENQSGASLSSDPDLQLWCDHENDTIGDVLGYLVDGNTAAENTVSAISDGLFDTSFLRSYPHHCELVLCCAQAISDLAAMPYSRKSLADVMGRAMELLRRKRGVAVPRGWYPVMKQLRGQGAEPQAATANGAPHPHGQVEEVSPEQRRMSPEQRRMATFSPAQDEYERGLMAWHATGKPLKDFHDQFKPSPENAAGWWEWEMWHEHLRTWAIASVEDGTLQNLPRHRGNSSVS